MQIQCLICRTTEFKQALFCCRYMQLASPHIATIRVTTSFANSDCCAPAVNSKTSYGRRRLCLHPGMRLCKLSRRHRFIGRYCALSNCPHYDAEAQCLGTVPNQKAPGFAEPQQGGVRKCTHLSAKQAQKKLGCVAGHFADAVWPALGEWMKAADDLRSHVQYPCTEATRQLLQAALQQCPQTTQQHAQVYHSWVKKHIPGISKAMLECTRRQLDISNKRISVLKSLMKSCQQHDRAQLQSRCRAENGAHLLLETQFWVLCIMLPVAALCDDLAGVCSEFPGLAASARAHQDGCRRDQGRTVLSTHNLELAMEARTELQGPVSQAGMGLLVMGVPVGGGPPRHVASFDYVFELIAYTDLVWLQLAVQVLPNHTWALQFLLPLFGPVCGLHPSYTERSLQSAKSDLFCLLAHPGLYPAITQTCGPALLGRILQCFQVQAQHLEAAGAPEAAQQELLSMMQYAASCEDAFSRDVLRAEQLLGDQPATSNDSARDSRQQGEDPSMASATAKAAATNNAAADALGEVDRADTALDSMHALLQLMYGCTI